MKILLPMDHSDFSQRALNSLIAQPYKKGTQVLLLHAIEPITTYITAGLVPEITYDSEQLEADRHKQAKVLLDRAAQKLRKAGLKPSERIEFGDPKSCILDAADSWRADLIVLGSHGLRGLSHFLLGSVSEAVMRHAKCSVTIVRTPAKSAAKASKPKK